MKERPMVLVIGDAGERTAQLRAIFSRSARVMQAEDLPQALELLAQQDYEAVFVDWRYHCGTWRDALQRLEALYPELPVIVISQTSGIEEGIQEWAEVVGAGAFDLLLSVYNEPAAWSLLEHAVASGQARAMRAIA